MSKRRIQWTKFNITICGIESIRARVWRIPISSSTHRDPSFFETDIVTTEPTWDNIGAAGASTTIWTSRNDGSGSGLDADLFDGLQASQFLKSDALDTQTYGLRIEDSRVTSVGNDPLLRLRNSNINTSSYANIELINGDGTTASIAMNAAGQGSYGGDTNLIFGGFSSHIGLSYVSNNSTKVTWNGETGIYNFVGTLREDGNNVWHAGNDGSGSGLDADTVDGLQASQLLRSDAFDISTGGLKFNTGTSNTGVIQFERNNTAHYMGIEFRTNSDRNWLIYTDNTTASNLNIQRRTDGEAVIGQVVKFRRDNGVVEFYENPTKSNGDVFWHAGNDGAGSGLDADLFDGLGSGSFAILIENTLVADSYKKISESAPILKLANLDPPAVTVSAPLIVSATSLLKKADA
jgi:hypothetical protein